MRTLQLARHLTDAELKKKLEATLGSPEFNRWQILYMVQVGQIRSAQIISPLVNLSKPSIYKIVEQYNKGGVKGIKYTARGGRRRSLLSIEEERALLEAVESKAEQGHIKTANDIRAMVEAKVGKAVSDDYLWDLLKRHGWKKKMPRPHHPQRSLDEQEKFKKNFLTRWHPSAGVSKIAGR
jgi:transposase